MFFNPPFMYLNLPLLYFQNLSKVLISQTLQTNIPNVIHSVTSPQHHRKSQTQSKLLHQQTKHKNVLADNNNTKVRREAEPKEK